MSAALAKFGDVPDIFLTRQLFWDCPGVLENKALVIGEASSFIHHQT